MNDENNDHDDDLLDIPDEFLPEIDDLPGELARVARIIDRIAPGHGVRAVLALAAEYRSTPIYVHNLDKLQRRVRDQKIIARYSAGERAECIARSARVSLRHLWTILGREPGVARVEDERQLKLF